MAVLKLRRRRYHDAGEAGFVLIQSSLCSVIESKPRICVGGCKVVRSCGWSRSLMWHSQLRSAAKLMIGDGFPGGATGLSRRL